MTLVAQTFLAVLACGRTASNGNRPSENERTPTVAEVPIPHEDVSEHTSDAGFTRAPFLVRGTLASAFDHDRSSGTTAASMSGATVVDNSYIWAWTVPVDTEILSVADAQILDIRRGQWSCRSRTGTPDDEGWTTAVYTEVVSYGRRFQVTYSNVAPSVEKGTKVNAGDRLGRTTGRSQCGWTLAIAVLDIDDDALVDPFGWKRDSPDPLRAAKGYKAIPLFALPVEDLHRLTQ
jgi:hypothetical protein